MWCSRNRREGELVPRRWQVNRYRPGGQGRFIRERTARGVVCRFLALEDPRFVMIVVIGDPKEGGYQGARWQPHF